LQDRLAYKTPLKQTKNKVKPKYRRQSKKYANPKIAVNNFIPAFLLKVHKQLLASSKDQLLVLLKNQIQPFKNILKKTEMPHHQIIRRPCLA
jgi:hypothetical protein